jgi:peptidoglycan hydrolase CwlO-like protein
MAGPLRDDHSYRRGLVFGWSLAEIFLLIVFALLFAFAAKVASTQPRNLTQYPGAKPALPAPTARPTDDFDSLFRKLTLCEERLKACNENEKQLQKEIAELKKQVSKLRKLCTGLNGAAIRDGVSTIKQERR